MTIKQVTPNDCPLYQMLREDQVDAFNQALEEGQTCDFTQRDFRGLDLRGAQLAGLDLSNAYFRGTDLRGIDFRGCHLDGVSLASARVSGCYFPVEINASEIQMSVDLGTRIRHFKPDQHKHKT